MTTDDHSFAFPPEYHFPPFFTPQPNTTTRHAQLTKWSALVLAYCRHHRVFRLSASPAHAPDELFHNRALGRRLSPGEVREVVRFMKKEGTAESVMEGSAWAGGGAGKGEGGGGGGDLVYVFWRSVEEWASLVEGWVDETGQKGNVVTVYEMVEGDGTRGTEIHGIDTGILLKALQLLVKRGKAQIFGQEESQGVKFF